MLIAEGWLQDMPQQFLGKKRIEVLIRAFARQLQELQRVFDDLTEKTGIDTAVGKNLDYVGTIIPLTRKEAGELAGIGVSEPVISDERYRLFLRYQLLRNTSECTYYDLIDGIELLWGYKGIHYREEPDHPATIIFQTDRMELDEEELVEFRPELCIRPAGVGVTLRKHFGGSYEVPVRYAEAVHFRTGFYPRFNLPQLKLNGGWKLNGRRKLNGFDSQDTIDLYPISIGFQMVVMGTPEEHTGLSLRVSAGEAGDFKSRESIYVRAAVECRAPRLKLDGKWKLGGGRRLSGYSTGELVDQYPVSTRFLTSAEASLEEKTRIHLISGAGSEDSVKIQPAVTVKTSAESRAVSKEAVGIRTSAACTAGVGDIRIYNKNLLGGGWKLNGSRKLNGGMEVR